MLEAAVQDLKDVITQHDGTNVANRAFVRRVDDLISLFYDDIGEITTVPTSTLFDLFVIKVLYVERASTDAAVVDYLGRLLDRYLYTADLFSQSESGSLSLFYLSDLLEEMARVEDFKGLFEAYRKYGDSSLLVTGVFPMSLRHSRRGRWAASVSVVDRTYYVSTGKRFYKMAAEHDLAEDTHQREILAKLSSYFEFYLEALNEVSERYLLGFDMQLIADKMLDSINQYRRTGEERWLRDAGRFAAILKVDPDALSGIKKQHAALQQDPVQQDPDTAA